MVRKINAKAREKAEKMELSSANAVDKMSKKDLLRLNLTLPLDLDRVLEDIGTQARFTKGYKLSKTLIIRALVRVMKIIDVDVTAVKGEKELLERLLEAVKKYR